jgi:hypothetical protein
MHACLPLEPARRTLALLLLAASLLAGVAQARPQPDPVVAQAPAPVPPSAFDRFVLADARLADDLLGPDGNERARRELQMTLRDRLGPWLDARNAQPARGQPPRTLRIEPTIVLVAYVDPLARAAIGPVAGPERLHVRVRLLDAADGRVIADTTLRAEGSTLASVAPLGATSSSLPRRIADELVELLEAPQDR